MDYQKFQTRLSKHEIDVRVIKKRKPKCYSTVNSKYLRSIVEN